jgi:hypothetical protein
MPANVLEIKAILEGKEPQITCNPERHFWKYSNQQLD